MAVYESLLLNTAVPQIQAAQTGDSYVMVVNATTPALRITQTGTGNALEVEDSANPDATPFVVSAAGDVGIGTNAPGAKLHVSGGNIRLDNNQGVEWGGGNNFIYGNEATDFVAIATNGSERARLDSSGNLGLGVTPSASAAPTIEVGNAGNCITSRGAVDFRILSGAFQDGASSWKYAQSGQPVGMLQMVNGSFGFNNAPSGTAGATTSITSGLAYSVTTLGSTTLGQWQAFFSALTGIPSIGQTVTATATGTLAGGATVTQIISFTTAMTLDASGNLVLGNTSVTSGMRLDVQGGDFRVGDDANQGFEAGYSAGGSQAFIQGYNRGTSAFIDLAVTGSNIKFLSGSSATERARITSGGYFKASNTGTYTGATGAYHEFNNNFSDYIVWAKNSVASGPFGIRVQYSAATPNGTGNEFLVCDDSTATRMTVRSNGGIANYSANDVNLASDERLKKDISPLASTWSRLKAVEVVNFRYKDCNEGDPALFGVIAQQVQPIVPELVVVTQQAKDAVEAKDAVLDADGNVVEPAVAAKEATPEYYGIREQPMYWLAIKALQEAMARIETLEAKIAALEAK